MEGLPRRRTPFPGVGMRFLRPFAAAALALGAAQPLCAQEVFSPAFRPELAVGRAGGSISVDGEIGAAEWAGAALAVGFSEIEPNEQARPPVDTEVLVAYDDERLYVAFRCQDDPRAVRATLTERDGIWSDDHVALLLDTYGSQSWAYELAANPYGVQGDGLWTATAGEDYGYDLVFDAAGRLTADGWQVEMAVPFASLRFPQGERQSWRANFRRVCPRQTQAEYAWSAQSRDNPCGPCQWGTLTGIERVRPGRGLSVLPTLTARQGAARRPDGGLDEGAVLGEPSLGARWNVSSHVAVETAFNPDFSQVESDAAQIDVNTTFALFYPEKRPFFLEGSDLFGTYFTAVHTRMINDPEFAVKLTGRPDRTSVAFLAAQDENTPYVLPFGEESAFVAAGRSWSGLLRARRSLGDESHLGLIATDRRLEGGGAGTLAGVDGLVRLHRNWRFQWQALASRTVEPDRPELTAHLNGAVFDGGARTAAFDGEEFDGRALYAGLRRRARHWNLNVDYLERSPTFRADLGFEPANDVREASVVNGGELRFASGFVQQLTGHLYLTRDWDFAGRRKLDNRIWEIGLRGRWAQLNGHVQVLEQGEAYRGRWYGGEWLAHTCWTATPHDAVTAHAGVSTGRRLARRQLRLGDELSGSADVTLRLLDRVVGELAWQYARSADPAGGATFYEGTIFRGALKVQLSPELGARLVVQRDGFAGVWEADPLLAYRLDPFSIFYVGSTRDYARFAPGPEQPPAWELAERTYFVKLQYLFQP